MPEVVPGVNDLARTHPELAKEADGWDPTTVAKSCAKKLQWRCPEGHNYKATPASRTERRGGTGCPYCSGNKVLKGFNDLSTLSPRLAREAWGWDPTTVSKGSSQKRAWRCSEGHVFESTVTNRTGLGRGCPYCSGLKVLKGVNDLATTHPELAAEADGWDPTEVKPKSNKKLAWKCPLGHKYEAVVSTRSVRGSGCPFCSGNKVLAGFNDLATQFPDLAKEAHGWDPKAVAQGSDKRLTWCCSLGHTWTAAVYSRTGGDQVGCPYCSGRQAWAGFNDLATTSPEVAKEADGWDPTTVTAASGKKLQWRCSRGHTWKTTVASRTSQKTGCPYCTNKTVLEGFNDLATRFPELAKEADGWDPTKVNPGTPNKLPWRCPLGHRYQTSVNNRTQKRGGTNCPYCGGSKVLPGFNDLASTHPELAKEADGWDPKTVTAGSTAKRLSWKCSCGHTWKTKVAARTGNGTGCPACADYGFNPEKEAWFYLLERPGEQQLGVTNDKKTRLQAHSQNGWSEVEVVGPANGKLVFKTEKALKKWLRNDVGLVPGTHENWFTSKLEVRSLAELKAKSGVETELF